MAAVMNYATALKTVRLPDESNVALDWSAISAHQTPSSLTTDVFTNTGHEFLYVKNTDTNTKTVTINSTHNCVFGTDHNVVFTVATNKEYMLGTFPVQRFGSLVSVTYSGTADLTGITVDLIRVD